MLIELGPRPQLFRGLDWHVLLVGDARSRQRYVVEVRNGFMWYGYQTASVLNAVRAYGFVVDDYGHILNWEEVPHLWECSSDAY